jgi:hypothetical protein
MQTSGPPHAYAGATTYSGTMTDKQARPSRLSVGFARQQLGVFWDQRQLMLATG